MGCPAGRCLWMTRGGQVPGECAGEAHGETQEAPLQSQKTVPSSACECEAHHHPGPMPCLLRTGILGSSLTFQPNKHLFHGDSLANPLAWASSTLVLAAFWAESFFVVGGCPVSCGILSTIPGLCPQHPQMRLTALEDRVPVS